MPRLPGATEELVLHELFAALRQLCEEGWAWPLDFGPLNVYASKPRIYLDPMPDNTRVGYVLRVRYEPASGANTRVLPLVHLPSVTDPGTPNRFYMENTGTLLLDPIPLEEELNSLHVACTLIPTSTTCRLPDFFFTHYRDAIIAGTCSRMMMMSNKSWADRAAGTMHAKQFKKYISQIRNTTKARYSLADGSWRFPHFAGQLV
jgi:hypothetical protein